jgi:hypothetical protein
LKIFLKIIKNFMKILKIFMKTMKIMDSLPEYSVSTVVKSRVQKMSLEYSSEA